MVFSTAALTFLRGLGRRDDRVWFEAHRAECEADWKEAVGRVIEELDVRLTRFAPEIIGEPNRSMFRIYRDIRFSPDKSPYKTHASCWLYHQDGSRAVGREADSEGAGGAGAGFYFQIAPGDSFVGGGMWMPPRDALRKLREAIADDPKRFTKIATDRRLVRRFGGLSEEAVLRRVPRGFAPDHAAAQWLKFQSFVLGRALTDAQAVSARPPALPGAGFRPVLPPPPPPVPPEQREARRHAVPAVDPPRIPADPDQSAPGLLPHHRSDAGFAEVPGQGIAAGPGHFVDDHHLGSVDRRGRTAPVRSLPRHDLAHERPMQEIHHPVGQLSPLVEPLVDDDRFLPDLREVIAIEIAVARP